MQLDRTSFYRASEEGFDDDSQIEIIEAHGRFTG